MPFTKTQKYALLAIVLMSVALVFGLLGSFPWWWTAFQVAFIAYEGWYFHKHRTPKAILKTGPSGAELLHRARNAFPAEDRAWFDELNARAGFIPPPALRDPEVARIWQWKPRLVNNPDDWDWVEERNMLNDEVRRIPVKLKKTKQIVPCHPIDGKCNPYFGEGTGWRHITTHSGDPLLNGKHEWWWQA